MTEAAFIIVPLVFIGFWRFFCFCISAAAGWNKLARFYRAENEFTGKLHKHNNCTLGGSRYQSALYLGSNQKGLYISVLFFIRWSHPPLFIPWSEITPTHTKDTFKQDIVEFEFAKNPGQPLKIYYELARTLAKYSDGFFILGKPEH